ncbi:putative neurogenic locus notch-like protein 1 isoform X6 [Apostichopus japonicus]|uniref:Putative neurogenic locus notch-like protein 1 isoform X6 n=1 Tax=Stichopus japonicus TaxID=307972 RepID=A0A2G8KLL7_STIJA|nr:putative neurogenic locus notch-like protein 1 isoform X6 [Apostichopus japonicus]
MMKAIRSIPKVSVKSVLVDVTHSPLAFANIMAVTIRIFVCFVLFWITFCILPSSTAGVGSTDQSSGACASQPCENDGNCIEVNAAFICVCPDGFNGLRCENNVSRPKSEADACTSNPCNAGICVSSGPDRYTCMCTAGWEGENCERDVDECRISNANCETDLTCVNTEGSYTCENLTCKDNPCRNGGLCHQPIGSYPRCLCSEGFTGLHCDMEIIATTSPEPDVGICDREPCQNQGECTPSTSSPSGFTCRCFSGFSGALCDVPLHVVCLYDEVTYHEADVRYVDCNECHCQKGSWFCTKKFCGTIHGSFHFINNYDLIEEDAEEFQRLLREDLINVFSIPQEMLDDIEYPGRYNSVSLQAQNDVKKISADIESMLSTANYSFTFQGEELIVDPDSVFFEMEQSRAPSSTDPNMIAPAWDLDTLYVIIIVISIGIVVLFVVLLCLARVCVKRHKAKTKAKQYQQGENGEAHNLNNSRQITTIPNHLYAVIDNSENYQDVDDVSISMEDSSAYHTYEKPSTNGSNLAMQPTLEYKELEPYRDHEEETCCQLERDILENTEL